MLTAAGSSAKRKLVDAVYDDVTSDPAYPKDAAVKAFIGSNRPPFVIEQTDVGTFERKRRQAGKPPKRNMGELAMMDFISDAGGVRRYLESGEPLLVLYEDQGLRVFQKPPNMHLLSTVGLLRGMERAGILRSADAVIREMTHPTRPDRRPQDRRLFPDLPGGVDEPAAIGSHWTKPRAATG